MKHWKSLIVAAALAVAVPSLTYAQAAPGGGDNNGGGNNGGGNAGGGGGQGGQGGQRGGNRGFDPARMAEMMKSTLGVQDDEWKVIEPKLKKVMEDQRELRSGGRGFGGPGGPGGRRGGDGGTPPPTPEPTTPVAKAAADLQASIKAGGADEAIDKKLSAYRDARDKAKTDMAADQKALKEVLTAKQEATLVLMGMLD